MSKRRRNSTTEGLETIVTEQVGQLVASLSTAIREQVVAEIQAHFGGNGASLPVGKRRKKRVMGCIAPGCKNTSKGPRFHYLCAKHMDAPKKDYEAWRAAKTGKQPSA